jgi:hypothetical protein
MIKKEINAPEARYLSKCVWRSNRVHGQISLVEKRLGADHRMAWNLMKAFIV